MSRQPCQPRLRWSPAGVAEATATVRAQRLVADEFDVHTQTELEDVLQRLLFLQQCVEMILVRFRLGFHLRYNKWIADTVS